LRSSFSIREPFVDALRALALLGVFIVNAMGYPSAPNYPLPLGAPSPFDSTIAIWINGFLVAFVQGKAYPLLCFLFGYSLCSIAFQTDANAMMIKRHLKVRYKKLLLVGVLHGAFVYFGDVLTVYAICGLIAIKWVKYRPKQLLKVFKNLTITIVILFVLLAALGLIILFDGKNEEIRISKEILENFMSVSNAKSYLLLNTKNYLYILLNMLLQLPILLWLTVAGILARRFRIFSLCGYARYFWIMHFSIWQFFAALFINIVIGIIVFHLQSQGSTGLNNLSAIGLVNAPICIWLISTTLALVIRKWHKVSTLPNWVNWLAPAGKHTLAMYLTLSLTLMLSSGAYLGLTGGTSIRLLVVLLAWFTAIWLAKYATKRDYRDPLASWLSAKI
jgi:uncharacterized protein